MAFDGKSERYCMNGFEAIDIIEAYGLNFALWNAVNVTPRRYGKEFAKGTGSGKAT